MAEQIRNAAVIGAGVMGSAIAAHLAGAGIRTHLLDIVPPDLDGADKDNPAKRSAFAIGGIQKALKAKPAAFYDPDAAKLMTPGNMDDHLDRLAECDLIVEAVPERMDIKRSVFEKIIPHINDTAILASNTSGLSIAAMSDTLPESLQPRFLVMHFFNPVRYMRLLELVAGPKTDPAVMEKIAAFGEFLGKGIVYGKDTANFVANRIGVYGMMQTFSAMSDFGLTIEEVDKIAGKPMGRPKSAAFRTADVVGIDTLMHVAQNCYDSLPDDEERDIFKIPEWIQQLVESGRIGQKTRAGFYKKEGKVIRVLDPETLDYRDPKKVRFESLGAVRGIEEVGPRLKALVNADDVAGKFAWTAMAKSLCYSARRVGEICDDIVNIDRAMRWGFNWELGPFQAWDAIGVPESVARMKEEGMDVPEWVVDMLESGTTSFYGGGEADRVHYDVPKKAAAKVAYDPRHIRLAALKEDKKNIVKDSLGATLVDLGDGCLCVEVHTKMNTIDDDVVNALKQGVVEAERNFDALVIGNDGDHFGAGANLLMIFMAAQQKAWDQVGTIIDEFQGAVQGLRYANVPVVSAPFGLTLGGGAEIAMGADVAQAYAETYMGLVEVGVGVIPAGCGCLRMVERWTDGLDNVAGADPLKFVGTGSLNIAMAKTSTGAENARRLRLLRETDGISLNRDHLLYQAKHRALGMAAAGYRPPRPRTIKAAGLDAAKTIGIQVWGMVEGGWASEHDALIANKVAHILCGGNVAAGTELREQDYLALEKEAFLSLCGEEKSQARMQSILMNNKPLRN
jgi:3-hydroxyacyl-CoA dehydrogenase